MDSAAVAARHLLVAAGESAANELRLARVDTVAITLCLIAAYARLHRLLMLIPVRGINLQGAAREIRVAAEDVRDDLDIERDCCMLSTTSGIGEVVRLLAFKRKRCH
jgi:hypothetical protein